MVSIKLRIVQNVVIDVWDHVERLQSELAELQSTRVAEMVSVPPVVADVQPIRVALDAEIVRKFKALPASAKLEVFNESAPFLRGSDMETVWRLCNSSVNASDNQLVMLEPFSSNMTLGVMIKALETAAETVLTPADEVNTTIAKASVVDKVDKVIESSITATEPDEPEAVQSKSSKKSSRSKKRTQDDVSSTAVSVS